MDRNTIIGFSLIGVILTAFFFLNKPSEEERKKAEQKLELEQKKRESAKNEKQEPAQTVPVKDSTAAAGPAVAAFKAETVTLESKDLIVELSTRGGIVSSVQLKQFESYNNFIKKDGKITPLYLFKAGDQSNQLEFPYKGTTYTTGNKPFTIKEKTAKRVVLEHQIGSGAIDYTYELKDGYDVKFDVSFHNLGEVSAKSVDLKWNMAMAKTEKLLSEQRRVSTVCFQYDDESFSYLKEMADDKQEFEKNVNWIAYKQSYFSAILQPDKAFGRNDAKASVHTYKEGEKNFHSHIKSYRTTVRLPLANTTSGTVSMNWFFGPNDYETLKSYHEGYDDILNFGWGIFRWINLYAVQPVFDLFVSTGMGIGLAILLLTLVLKIILMPVQWKMFVSSAKMRILRPEIDAINAKYPKKEDAMKKQMETLELQRTSGASPLSGCIPLLFQMPILLAVFRFFPAAFELRQRGFLWAEDLSSYDSIVNFGTFIPLYGDHVSLFTLLMSATTLIYTYLNSSNVAQQQQPGMPNMKVLMYIFPLMMIFFFNNYASGLSYYYFISTLMTILIMVIIKRFFVDEEKLKEKMAAAKVKKASGNTGKKKPSFMQRVEEMQKQQAEAKKKK